MKRRRSSSKISSLIEPWIDGLQASRDHLRDMLRLGKPNLIEQASNWHLETATALHRRVVEVVRGMRFKENPLGPKDLTDLISSFKLLREQAERDRSQAIKMSHKGSRTAKKAARAADESEAAVRAFAAQMKRELEAFGDWGRKMVKALGVDLWL